jgi:DNA-binding NarL/FixJ family response regulator
VIGIVIADDHEVVRQGERTLIASQPDFRILGEASDGVEAIRVTERVKPDVLLVDISMPGMSGIEVLARVREVSPKTAAVVFSMYTSQFHVAQAFRSGARGYVSKATGTDDLLEAIRAVAAGKRYLGRDLADRAIELYIATLEGGGDDPWTALSAREREVLLLAAEGLSNVQIGERLFISPRTVETHRGMAMRKLGLRGQTELVLYVVHHGLLTPEERV